jgi:hypothetical protein
VAIDDEGNDRIRLEAEIVRSSLALIGITVEIQEVPGVNDGVFKPHPSRGAVILH